MRPESESAGVCHTGWITGWIERDETNHTAVAEKESRSTRHRLRDLHFGQVCVRQPLQELVDSVDSNDLGAATNAVVVVVRTVELVFAAGRGGRPWLVVVRETHPLDLHHELHQNR